MIRAECVFKDGQAGYITAPQIFSEETTYDFMPYRSLAHLLLTGTVEKEKRAPVTLLYQAQQVEMVVTKISARSITLIPAQEAA